MTFCVADRSGSGTCVSRCDFERLPQSGCRAGYGCARVSRIGEPETIVDACMPLGIDGRARPLNDLQPELERVAIAANIESERIVLVDVTEGRAPTTAALHPLDPVYPASVIKVVVMAEVEHQIEQGLLSRATRFTVDSEEETCTGRPDGDTRPVLDAGDTADVDFLVDVMITRSDNTATNVLVDHVARHKANAFMTSLGLPTLQVHRKTFGCEPYTDSGWDGKNLNTMTALETARLYRLILDGGPGFVGPGGRTRMLDVLGGQLLRGGVASTLPDDARYLSKTGNTSEVVHDSGIILWRGQRYVLAAFLEMEPDVGRPRLKELGAGIAKIMAAR
jgi:beta-lactamase class A